MPKLMSVFFTVLGYLGIPFSMVTIMLGAFRLAGISGSLLWVPAGIGLALGVVFLVWLSRKAPTMVNEKPGAMQFREWSIPLKLIGVAAFGLVIGLFAVGLPTFLDAWNGRKTPVDCFWDGSLAGALGGISTLFVAPWFVRRNGAGSR